MMLKRFFDGLWKCLALSGASHRVHGHMARPSREGKPVAAADKSRERPAARPTRSRGTPR